MLTWSEKKIILFGGLITAGYLYTLDWPQSLQTPLKQQPYEFSSMQYNMIYVATMLPMALLSIPIGMVIDRISFGKSVWFFLGFQVITQIMMAIIFFNNSKNIYFITLILRLLYGLTTQSSFTIQSIALERTMSKQNLDFALNLCYTVPMLFDALNSFISTQTYQKTQQIFVPLAIGAIFCIVALFAGVILIPRVNQNTQINQTKIKCKIQDIKELTKQFWIFIFLVFLGECCNGPFLDNLTDLLVKRFGIPYTLSGILTMIPTGLIPLFSLIWFWIIKKNPQKRRLVFFIIGLQTLIVHLILTFLSNTNDPSVVQYITIIVALLSFSSSFAGLLGIIEVSIGMIVPQNLLGAVYGSIGAVNALALALMPIFNGEIMKHQGDNALSYLSLEYIYFPLSLIYATLLLYTYINKSPIFQLFDEQRGKASEQKPLQLVQQRQQQSQQHFDSKL